ncbi:MAG TPA: hypothetical protein VFV78_10855 [Vicinamibacterales bacterium]|nr:hypothetical protein [Vicinamibacterales bacterium]
MRPSRTIPIVLAAAVVSTAISAAIPAAPQAPTFTRAYPLAATEGVFAYSRISPDGRYLAYASQAFDTTRKGSNSGTNLYGPTGMVKSQTVTIVDLATSQVLYRELGIDPYWSLDNERVIYSGPSVSIWHRQSGQVSRNVVPGNLGDYYSWAVKDGRNLILTITGNYYYLDGDKGVMPASKVPNCPGIGAGDRPLISKDGLKITTFVRGNVIVRNLADCGGVINTGIAGQKADFSYDGRYIAFHAQRTGTNHYDILVVDLETKTVRTVTAGLPGSSLFPNFTRDGRLSFRYDSPEYRGFMFASDFLNLPASPLPAPGGELSPDRVWRDVFAERDRPNTAYTMVLIWSTWSAHSPIALDDMQRARAYFRDQHYDLTVLSAAEPASQPDDVTLLLSRNNITLPSIPVTPAGLAQTEGRNQMPTTLLFRGDRLIDRRLGAQSFDELVDWVTSAGAKAR